MITRSGENRQVWMLSSCDSRQIGRLKISEFYSFISPYWKRGDSLAPNRSAIASVSA